MMQRYFGVNHYRKTNRAIIDGIHTVNECIYSQIGIKCITR